MIIKVFCSEKELDEMETIKEAMDSAMKILSENRLSGTIEITAKEELASKKETKV